MAEDLTEYFLSMGVNAKYLHSDIDTLERMSIIHALRKGEFNVLIGINLLREGLDIPEVSLVAILDADKEGFLRSTGSLIQTFGRAARNASGKVILYADTRTASMQAAMDETDRRREKQIAFNAQHGITPATILKAVDTPFDSLFATASPSPGKGRKSQMAAVTEPEDSQGYTSPRELAKVIQRIEREMRDAARELEFERAAELRDRIRAMRSRLMVSEARGDFP